MDKEKRAQVEKSVDKMLNPKWVMSEKMRVQFQKLYDET